MRVALDTNILAYAEGVNGDEKRRAASTLIDRLPLGTAYVPLQVIGELFNVLIRKARISSIEARERLATVRTTFLHIDTTPSVMDSAIDLATSHGLTIWDSVIVAAASSVGCALLLSEDMQDGFVWGGVTVANPFADRPQPIVRRFLGS